MQKGFSGNKIECFPKQSFLPKGEFHNSAKEPADEKLIKARRGMLSLAEELQNISLACRRAGISRSHLYEIKTAFEKFKAEGLVPRTRCKPRMPNQTPPELERKILVRQVRTINGLMLATSLL